MIASFRGKYAFLSNFYPSLIFIDGDNLPCSTVEHYFQVSKTRDFMEAIEILQAKNPSEAKRLGKKCTLRTDWEQIKDQVMEDALRKKFSIPALKQLLLETGDEELQEGNSWNDTYWGVCNGVGENKLGKLLMKIREEIKEGD